MELISIRHAMGGLGEFLEPYKAVYTNGDGNLKTYEMVSRNKDLTKETFGKTGPAAAGIIAFTKDRSRILLAKEFRMACNRWVYNFPAGLMEEGETAIEAARRELKEETGLDISGVIADMGPSYSAVGISDEQVHTIVCTAEGDFAPSTSADEEICAAWFTKTEIRSLLRNREPMAQRTQAFLWMWCYGSIFE